MVVYSHWQVQPFLFLLKQQTLLANWWICRNLKMWVWYMYIKIWDVIKIYYIYFTFFNDSIFVILKLILTMNCSNLWFVFLLLVCANCCPLFLFFCCCCDYLLVCLFVCCKLSINHCSYCCCILVYSSLCWQFVQGSFQCICWTLISLCCALQNCNCEGSNEVIL